VVARWHHLSQHLTHATQRIYTAGGQTACSMIDCSLWHWHAALYGGSTLGSGTDRGHWHVVLRLLTLTRTVGRKAGRRRDRHDTTVECVKLNVPCTRRVSNSHSLELQQESQTCLSRSSHSTVHLMVTSLQLSLRHSHHQGQPPSALPVPPPPPTVQSNCDTARHLQTQCTHVA